jgi:integrase/recombinase XerD
MAGASRKPNLTLIRTQSQNQTLRDALDAFIDDKRAGNRTPKTLAYYAYELGRFIVFALDNGGERLDDITPAMLRAYLIALQKRGLSDKSQDAAWRALHAWLAWCVKQEWLEAHPLDKVTRPAVEAKILSALDIDEVHTLLRVARNPRDKAIVLCLLDSGCRVSEFVALDVGDYDREDGTVTVLYGKGRKQRTTYFGPKARAALSQYLFTRGRPKKSDPLWVSLDTGQRLTVSGLQQVLKRLGKDAGFKVSPHDLRRTCALWAHREGWRLTEIQRLLGHSDLSMLRRYLDLDDSDVAEAHRKAPPSGRL